MSIYIMTVGELAKKRGMPVADLIRAMQESGMVVGSHAKKLTQSDVDEVVRLLDGAKEEEKPVVKAKSEPKTATNPNVLLIKVNPKKTLVLSVDAKVNDDGSVSIEVLQTSEETSVGDALLEFRKQQGLTMGVN